MVKEELYKGKTLKVVTTIHLTGGHNFHGFIDGEQFFEHRDTFSETAEDAIASGLVRLRAQVDEVD